MDEEKRFYWIKLKTDFFREQGAIDYLLDQKNGAEYVVLYIKLCLATANTSGRLGYSIGEVLVPYDVEKIAKDMKYFSVDTVRVALELYQRLGLVYQQENGLLAISGHDGMVGSESATPEAIRKRRSRENQKAIGAENVTESVTPNVTESVTKCHTEYRDKSLEIRDKSSEDIEDIGKKRKRFIPPTLEEVEEYILEKGYHVNAETWFSHYSSNGWLVGKNKMKDWKASVTYWNSQERHPSPKKQDGTIDWDSV